MSACDWLDETLKARYRDAWAHGLDPALNYYRASPMRPPSDDASVMNLHLDDTQLTSPVPTTVIWGEDDIALPVKLVEGLERWVPNLRVVRVPGASHWIVHERPDLIADTLESALAT